MAEPYRCMRWSVVTRNPFLPIFLCHRINVSCSWQARGKFGLRTKSVHVHEKTFLEEAERKVLSGALSQWQRKAEGDAAAAALGVGIAEARLLHASSR